MKDIEPGLELPNNQRPANYDQNFVKAPMSLHPKRYDKHELKAEHNKILDQVLYGK